MGSYDHLKGHDPVGEEEADRPKPTSPAPAAAAKTDPRAAR